MYAFRIETHWHLVSFDCVTLYWYQIGLLVVNFKIQAKIWLILKLSPSTMQIMASSTLDQVVNIYIKPANCF